MSCRPPDGRESGQSVRGRAEVGRARFDRYVRRAMRRLPTQFGALAENVAVRVTRDAPAGKSRGVRKAGTLFGTYVGNPRTVRTSSYSMTTPDVITLFRRPLARAARSRRRLEGEIYVTLLHEFGHYLGLDEDALEQL